MSKMYKLKFVGPEPVRLLANNLSDLQNGDVVEVDESAYEALRTHVDFEEIKTKAKEVTND